jgi:hypothetical protein
VSDSVSGVFTPAGTDPDPALALELELLLLLLEPHAASATVSATATAASRIVRSDLIGAPPLFVVYRVGLIAPSSD